MRILRTESTVFSNNFLSNLPTFIALIMLGSALLFLLQDKEEIANQLAGYAFYLLAISILWKIVQYLMNGCRHEGEVLKKSWKYRVESG